MWTYRCPPAAPAAAPRPGDTFRPPVAVQEPQPHTKPPAAPPIQPAAATPARPSPVALPARRLRARQMMLLPATVYLAGLGGGTLLARALPALEPFLSLYSQNLPQAESSAGAELLFSTTFLGHMGMLLGMLLAGLCALGAPLIFLLLLLRGVWESGYVLSLYANSGWQGIGLYTLVFWLPGLIFTVLQLNFALDALRMSRQLRKNCLSAGGAGLQAGVRRFLSRFLLFGGLGVAAAFLQVAFYLLLGPVAR